MDLPSHGDIERALHIVLKAQGNKPLTAQDAYRLLAGYFNLSWQQTHFLLKNSSGGELKWQNRCRTARNHLVRRGIMRRGPRNCWRLTDSAFALPGPAASLDELGL